MKSIPFPPALRKTRIARGSGVRKMYAKNI